MTKQLRQTIIPQFILGAAGSAEADALGYFSLIAGSGITLTSANGSLTVAATNAGTVTSVTGTSPITSSGGATPAIALATGYGDTQNPYASKTANFVLAGPATGANALPVFRTLVSSDIPALDASILSTGTVSIARGGTGAGTLNGARTALTINNVDNTSDLAKPISTATQTALDAKAPLASPTFTGTVSGITKTMVGLGNVDNTSDTAKPISTATQTALDAKLNTSSLGAPNGAASLDSAGKVPSTQLPSYVDDVLEFAAVENFPATGETGKIYIAINTGKCYRWSGTVYVEISTSEVNSVAGKTGVVTLVKADVGLGNVDNTSDTAKPISTAVQNALDLKAPLASPTFTGTPTAPTATAGTSTTQVATTAFVAAAVTGGTVTSVTGTSPVSVATGTSTPVISLASGYGDTQNPFASKTANFVLAAPNGSAGVPTFRALAAADIPDLDMSKLTSGTLPDTRGGTGITSLGTGVSTFLGTPTSANLAAAVTDETGTGSLVFANSPDFTGTVTAPTPILGTANTTIATTAFVQNTLNKTVARQIVGSFTTTGSQNSFTITPPAHLLGCKRWGFDWSLQGTYTSNNNQMIYIRINNREQVNDYRSVGMFVDSISPPASPAQFDWSSLYSNTLIILAVGGIPGQNLAVGTGGFFNIINQMWMAHSIRHIQNYRLCDLLYQSGYFGYGNDGLLSVQFGSYSRDTSTFTNFPAGFTATVWCESVI